MNQIEAIQPEEELTFTPPATRRALPMALLRARESVMSRFRPMLHAHGITEQQWRVMRVLSEENTLDATLISERANIFASSLSRILKTLERRGVIVRRQSSDDARRVQIQLTESGYQTIGAMAPESLAIYAELEKEFGGHDRVTELIRMLNDLSDLRRSGGLSE
jgi:homoprotocatechuate degradation regulator HpaR